MMACDPDADQVHTLGLETLPIDHSIAKQERSRGALPSGVSRPNKFGAVPTTVDAIRFASKKESRRYLDLKLMEKAGLIRDLECQPKFPIHVVPQTAWGGTTRWCRCAWQPTSRTSPTSMLKRTA